MDRSPTSDQPELISQNPKSTKSSATSTTYYQRSVSSSITVQWLVSLQWRYGAVEERKVTGLIIPRRKPSGEGSKAQQVTQQYVGGRVGY